MSAIAERVAGPLWSVNFLRRPSAIEPSRHDLVRSLLAAVEQHPLYVSSTRGAPTDENYWSELGSASKLRPYVVVDGVLQIPVKGVLLHDFSYAFFDYATGYDYIWRAFERGMADGNVRGIALVIDSPGGMVAGCFDACDKMTALKADTGKPVRAYAAESAYSAAYAVACVGDTITVSRTGGVGSVGVVTMHVDYSAALEKEGVKVTFIHAGKHKVDGNAYEPLPDDVKARIQSRIDEMYSIFVDHVAAGRSMTPEAVRATEALCFTASEAKSNGMADAIGTLDDSLAAFAADLSLDTGNQPMPISNKALSSACTVEAAVKADRERRAAIMSCEAAAGQEKFAEHIAQNTDLTVEQAIGCMLANAKDITAAKAKNSPNAFSQFMDRSEQPNVGASVSTVREGDDAGDDESARATASLCKRLGLKGFKDS